MVPIAGGPEPSQGSVLVLCSARVRRNRNAILAAVVGLCVAGGGAGAAMAAEVTRVVSGSRGAGELVDLHLSLGWTHEHWSAAIRREIEGQATGGQVGFRND